MFICQSVSHLQTLYYIFVHVLRISDVQWKLLEYFFNVHEITNLPLRISLLPPQKLDFGVSACFKL